MRIDRACGWTGHAASNRCGAPLASQVTRNNGNMFIAAFRKRLDPLAPRPPAIANDNAIAAAAASDAGYTPKEGGERRGMTW